MTTNKAHPITSDEFDEGLAIHSSEERAWMRTEIDRILHAFPDGIDAHRAAHEQMLAAAKAEEAFWRDLRTDVAKKSIWGILQILIILVFGTLAAKLGLGALIGMGK